jgi:hypothetical protein
LRNYTTIYGIYRRMLVHKIDSTAEVIRQILVVYI